MISIIVLSVQNDEKCVNCQFSKEIKIFFIYKVKYNSLPFTFNSTKIYLIHIMGVTFINFVPGLKKRQLSTGLNHNPELRIPILDRKLKQNQGSPLLSFWNNIKFLDFISPAIFSVFTLYRNELFTAIYKHSEYCDLNSNE